MGVNKMLVLNCQKMLEINCHFLLESTCRLHQLAKEEQIQELHAEIYSFNTQSQKMFQSIGFIKVDDEQYVFRV